LSHDLSRELAKLGITSPHTIKNEIDLANFF
jgi:hypothetical protein